MPSELAHLAIQALAVVNSFKNLVELMVRGVGELVHGGAASLLNPTPVEIVAHIQNKGGIQLGRSHLEGFRHQDLWLIINALISNAEHIYDRDPGAQYPQLFLYPCHFMYLSHIISFFHFPQGSI